MDENKQYPPRELYYSEEETNKNTNFRWEQPEANQSSKEEIEAFLTT